MVVKCTDPSQGQDCVAVQGWFAARGVLMTLPEAYEFWSDYSADVSAGWMSVTERALWHAKDEFFVGWLERRAER